MRTRISTNDLRTILERHYNKRVTLEGIFTDKDWIELNTEQTRELDVTMSERPCWEKAWRSKAECLESIRATKQLFVNKCDGFDGPKHDLNKIFTVFRPTYHRIQNQYLCARDWTKYPMAMV